MQTTPRMDPKDFRRALGAFGTGVTVVTTRSPEGENFGVTANSFNSVSLSPPMVLWSLAKNARSLAAFQSAPTWNVHILSNAQEALSNRFARSGEDKFAGLELDSAPEQVPLLPHCTARFQCKTAFQYEGGDHIIFVGEVTAYDTNPYPPLLYVAGGYALASRLSQPVSTEPHAQAYAQEHANSYSENLMGYLLGRAHHQMLHSLRPAMQAQGMTELDFYVLSVLSVQQPLNAAEIAQHMGYTGMDVSAAVLQTLSSKGWIQPCAAQRWQLSACGNRAILHVLAAAKAAEDSLFTHLGALEATALRNLLKKAIAATDPGLPKLWQAKPNS